MRRLASLLLTIFTMPLALAERSIYNMPRGVTPISRDIYDLHMTILAICVLIGIIVFSVLIFALVKHRKSKGHVAAQFHSNTKIEIAWTIIPFLILVAMAVPATIVLMRMDDTSRADINIKVTGSQWKWQYEYLDQGIKYFSNLSTPQSQIKNLAIKNKWYLLQVDNPMVVPIHEKIRFLVTSNDVIHAWYVPDLGIKRDAIPGFIHEAWARIDRPGIYRGQCAELCGANHAFMPIVVVAVTKADYQQWLAGMKSNPQKTMNDINLEIKHHDEALPVIKPESVKALTESNLMTAGIQVYQRNCAVCHRGDGHGLGQVFPSLIGAKTIIGDPQATIDIIANGKPGTSMTAYKETLDANDIAAVASYIRNTWGNNDIAQYGPKAGGFIQPTDVKPNSKTGAK